MRFKILFITLILIAFSCSSVFAQNIVARDSFKKGYQLFAKGKYYQSINSFKIATKDYYYPLLDYAYFYIAKAYHKKARYNEAQQVYQIILTHFRESVLVPKALFALAQIQIARDNHTETIDILRELITRFPKHDLTPHARFLLGQTLEKQKKYIDAARVYRNLNLLHSRNSYAEKSLLRLDQLARNKHLAGYEGKAATVYNLGMKYFNKRNYKKAKEYFTRLRKFHQKSSFYDEATMMYGRIYLRGGKLKSAAKYFNKCINLGKDSKAEAMYYLALTYDYMDSRKAAIRTLEKLITMYPNSALADDALFFIGRYYSQVDDFDKAIEAYKKLLTSYPNSDLFVDTIWFIGQLHYKQKNYHEAYLNFSQVFNFPPEKASDRLIFWAAKCAAKIGKRDKAIATYKMTINRYDHSYYGYRAREELKKLGLEVKVNAVPDVAEIIETIDGGSILAIEHEKKYKELIALGLGDEAAEEASFIEEKVPPSKKDKAKLAKYHAYIMKGKYAKPIWFADKKIREAMQANSLSDLEPKYWRFSYPRGYWKYVEKYSKEHGLDPHLVYAVIREESRFKSRALSRSWAHGLMQIIPSTGRRICRALDLRYSRWKMYNPRVNIRMGTYYLSTLIKRFDGNVSLALAGYNGGPVRVSKWMKKYDDFDIDEFVEDIPFRETRNYVKKVMKSYYGYKRTYSSGG